MIRVFHWNSQKSFKTFVKMKKTLPKNSKKRENFPNILFGNHVKYSPLSREQLKAQIRQNIEIDHK